MSRILAHHARRTCSSTRRRRGRRTTRSPTRRSLKLIEQLGAPSSPTARRRQKALRELGTKAEPALKVGLGSENPEVRERCAKLLTAVRADARDALAKNFRADDRADPDHPVWTRFKAVVGGDKPARALFADQPFSNPSRQKASRRLRWPPQTPVRSLPPPTSARRTHTLPQPLSNPA